MEYVDLGRFVFSLFLVVGLIGLMALLIRRFGSGHAKVHYGADARLEVLEILPLDARSRLLLVRRDDKQHLLVSSPEGVRVVEEGIASAATPAKKTKKPEEGKKRAA